MKKILLIVIMLLTSLISFSQHLTYSTFMKVIKIGNVSSLNDLMDSYGYNYGGIYVHNKGSQDAKQSVFWLKNCHLDLSTGDIEWKNGADRSYLALEYMPGETVKSWYRYTFHSKTAYKTFINVAKQNGFKFKRDSVDKTYIYSIYERPNKAKQYIEYLEFDEFTDQRYCVSYWTENL